MSLVSSALLVISVNHPALKDACLTAHLVCSPVHSAVSFRPSCRVQVMRNKLSWQGAAL